MEMGPASTDLPLGSILSQGSSVPQPWDDTGHLQSVLEKQEASIMQGVEEKVRKTLRVADVLRPGEQNMEVLARAVL